MLGSKKQQFYVQFLGWVECKGIRGAKYTDPVIHDLKKKQGKWKYAPKLTIQVNKRELRISQEMQEEKKKSKKIKKIQFPTIPTRDITYCIQAETPEGRPDDIVACIYLGYVPRTQRYVHVHVYRFDSPETAASFVRTVNQTVTQHAERLRDIERQLILQGEIEDPRLNSSDGMSERHTTDSGADSNSFSDDNYPFNESDEMDEIEADLRSLHETVPYDSVTEELKNRLRMTEKNEAPPLLLPPKDYDTLHRNYGDLGKSVARKCLQIPIVGSDLKSRRPRNSSEDTGIEIPSPTSSEGKITGLDNSDRLSSGHSSSNGIPTPPISARDYIYPPKLERANLSPRTSGDYDRARQPPSRQLSMNSGYSGHSYRSESSEGHSAYTHERKSNNFTDIPPADYEESPEPILMRRDIEYLPNQTRNVPSDDIQREMDYGYAVVAKRLPARESSDRMSGSYGAPSFGLHRVNSVHK
ncbi:hypothetical protein CHS0354_034351 [Potamilus streckersoni]|uniref:Uncharacterized protein n=1 Tax=Potamilus streckersoni TaxID=2493646 RepID=A0AAE0WG23_9BIVA|nr:hypothetical protein CHS0354_034351 [Potamilus streckersoni]